MHPGFFGWWHRRGADGEGASAVDGCGPSACGPRARRCGPGAFHGHVHGGWHGHGHGDGVGGLGVRRPLRFLAFKLGLDDAQVAELAKILNELKTERAQAEVDHRRTLSAFADAVSGEAFDQKKAHDAAQLRTDSTQKLGAAIEQALTRIHALLTNEQREQLAYLIRTGVLAI